MGKSVYSIVLMDDVVRAVDALAYNAGTSRSNMINRILAEYTSLATPEQRMQDIFSAIQDFIGSQTILQPILSASDAMLSLRSALQYKYNPSVRYIVELYPHTPDALGEMRAVLRTQNPNLILYMGQFYKLWHKLEAAYLDGPVPRYSAQGARFTRTLRMPRDAMTSEQAGTAIANYIALFDTCLKTYFDNLSDPAAAVGAVRAAYTANLDQNTAQL